MNDPPTAHGLHRTRCDKDHVGTDFALAAESVPGSQIPPMSGPHQLARADTVKRWEFFALQCFVFWGQAMK